MGELDESGRRLLRLLVEQLPTTDADDPRRMLGYKEALDKLGLKNFTGNAGESLKRQGLNNLADWTKSHGKPGISAIIVSKSDLSPGLGFYKLFGRQNDDFRFWREQVDAAKAFDWSPYLGVEKSEAFEPDTAPDAIDLNEPPARVETSVFRIIRDTRLSREIKEKHNFECQICGSTIILPDGGRYAEGHHIKPLGSPHSGPDVADNIICLCPNHHAEMDYGVRKLDRSLIRSSDTHKIGEDYLAYHNTEIYRERSTQGP